jgi:hypothetical protein
MNALELLKKYPKSAEVIKEWFFDKMAESIDDSSVPEDFKKSMMEEALTDERLSMIIDANPRMLFDIFDYNELYIEIFMYPDVTFTCKIGNEATTNSWKTRKEAEMFAVEVAFDMLENKLKPTSDDSNVIEDSEDN